MLPHRLVVTLALGALAAGVSACGDDAVTSDAAAFCEQAATNRDMIVAPPMTTEAEVQATLDFYRLMGELAPIAIAEQWGDVVTAMETASTLVPGNETSEQLVAMTAYASERSAYEISVWLKRNCDVDIPVETIAPQEALPPPTTTLAQPEGTGTASDTATASG